MELISARVCRQTSSAFAAVISPRQINGRLAPLITRADRSRSRASISSRALIASSAISKKSSTRISASARRTARPGVSRIKCRRLAHIRRCSRTSIATPVLSINFTLPSSNRQWRLSVERRSHVLASRRIDTASSRSAGWMRCQVGSTTTGELDGPQRLAPGRHFICQLSATYRLKRRRGSCSMRKIHSVPVRCIQRGARFIRPARKSMVAPTPMVTGTPSER